MEAQQVDTAVVFERRRLEQGVRDHKECAD